MTRTPIPSRPSATAGAPSNVPNPRTVAAPAAGRRTAFAAVIIAGAIVGTVGAVLVDAAVSPDVDAPPPVDAPTPVEADPEPRSDVVSPTPMTAPQAVAPADVEAVADRVVTTPSTVAPTTDPPRRPAYLIIQDEIDRWLAENS